MFDYLKCDYALPIPEALEDDEGFLLNKLDFQTHSFFPSSLDEYEITEDGQLYQWKIKRILKNNSGALDIEEERGDLLKLDYTGEIFFHGVYLSNTKDYYMEYKTLFWKGDLKEAHLEDVKIEDSSARLEAQEKLSSYVCEVKERRGKWWFPIFNVIRKLMGLINFCIRWTLGWGVKLTWKIDRWFSN